MQVQNKETEGDQGRLKRLWRPLEIHKFYGETETEED